MKKKLLLITGVPGTGKTTVGNYLANNHGFTHHNLEDHITGETSNKEAVNTIEKISLDNDTVLTWGFHPYWSYIQVLRLQNKGFKLIWFDGNRIFAYSHYRNRGGDEKAFYEQLNNITSSRIVELLNPYILNPFNVNGDFRAKEETAEEVLQYIN